MGTEPIRYFVVDAFTESPFKGNPAAVCFLEEDKDEKWLQSVAAEFNISETCYLIPISASDSNPRFHLRWFTPAAEVKLCGHATLAAAHTLFCNGLVKSDVIEFHTLSGILTAKKVPLINKSQVSERGKDIDSFLIELDFPSIQTAEFNSVDRAWISRALNGAPIVDVRLTTVSDNIFVVLPSAKDVAEVQPNIDKILKCPGMGVIVTGHAPPESGFDFYSRYFCPKFGINEDPVCGSAHCSIAPYWGKKLGKCDLLAYQASPRSGILDIHVDEANGRVQLRGKAVTVMEGHLLV